jgi:hypothetical protein
VDPVECVQMFEEARTQAFHRAKPKLLAQGISGFNERLTT